MDTDARMEAWRASFESKMRKVLRFAKGRNREAVEGFIRFKQSQGVGYARLTRLCDFLWHLVSNFDVRFDALGQQDVEDVLVWINGRQWKDWTKAGYTKIMKTFVSWLNERYGLGINLKVIKAVTPKNSVMPEYLITPGEFNRMLAGAEDKQLRLQIGLLYETAVRISELCTLRIQNVSFNSYGARLSIKGKTGQRVVVVVWYANLLREFIESHPMRDNPEACLWYHVTASGEFRPVNADMLRMRIKRLCRGLGIKKRIYPHLFRHTRLTELAGSIPEQTLKAAAGWAGDSRMARVYIHLSNKDVEDSLLSKVYGIKVEDGDGKGKLRICARCGEPNPYFTKLCQRCKTPLNEKELADKILSEDKAKEVERWSKTFMEFLKAVEKKHPDIWADMKEAMGPDPESPA